MHAHAVLAVTIQVEQGVIEILPTQLAGEGHQPTEAGPHGAGLENLTRIGVRERSRPADEARLRDGFPE